MLKRLLLAIVALLKPSKAPRRWLTPDELGQWAAQYGASAVTLDSRGCLTGASFHERQPDAWGRLRAPQQVAAEESPEQPAEDVASSAVDAALMRMLQGGKRA